MPPDADADAVLEHLTLTKAFLTEGEANDEATRLNTLNDDDQWFYFVNVARLVTKPDGRNADPSG